jgi:hypothetical protein
MNYIEDLSTNSIGMKYSIIKYISFFRSMMLLQRHLVDHDAKQSLYLHKLNRTKKTMAFLRQFNQAPNIYYAFLVECVRRKQYSNIFNQVCVVFYSIFIFFFFSFQKQFIGNRRIFIQMK